LISNNLLRFSVTIIIYSVYTYFTHIPSSNTVTSALDVGAYGFSALGATPVSGLMGS